MSGKLRREGRKEKGKFQRPSAAEPERGIYAASLSEASPALVFGEPQRFPQSSRPEGRAPVVTSGVGYDATYTTTTPSAPLTPP